MGVSRAAVWAQLTLSFPTADRWFCIHERHRVPQAQLFTQIAALHACGGGGELDTLERNCLSLIPSQRCFAPAKRRRDAHQGDSAGANPFMAPAPILLLLTDN
jgi:hypothetical protein